MIFYIKKRNHQSQPIYIMLLAVTIFSWSSLRFGRHRADVHRTSCALVFSLMKVRNTGEKDITQGKT